MAMETDLLPVDALATTEPAVDRRYWHETTVQLTPRLYGALQDHITAAEDALSTLRYCIPKLTPVADDAEGDEILVINRREFGGAKRRAYAFPRKDFDLHLGFVDGLRLDALRLLFHPAEVQRYHSRPGDDFA
jgi:hypothetical protein